MKVEARLAEIKGIKYIKVEDVIEMLIQIDLSPDINEINNIEKQLEDLLYKDLKNNE